MVSEEELDQKEASQSKKESDSEEELNQENYEEEKLESDCEEEEELISEAELEVVKKVQPLLSIPFGAEVSRGMFNSLVNYYTFPEQAYILNYIDSKFFTKYLREKGFSVISISGELQEVAAHITNIVMYSKSVTLETFEYLYDSRRPFACLTTINKLCHSTLRDILYKNGFNIILTSPPITMIKNEVLVWVTGNIDNVDSMVS